jgi:plastocyanin
LLTLIPKRRRKIAGAARGWDNSIQNRFLTHSQRRIKVKSRFVFILALFFTLGMIVLPQTSTAADSATTVDVKIDNFSFSPATITVRAGTQVTWTNRDDIPHTVVSDDKTTFKSHALDTDEKFSFTFTKAGTYPYFCSIHPHMTGKVVVE